MISRENISKIIFNSSLGLILILVWVRFVNFSSVFSILQKTRPVFLLPFLIFFLTSTILRSLRLKIFLKKYSIPAGNLIYLNCLSQFLSFFIPVRAGEIAKGVYLKKYDIPFARAITLVLIDRFFDFWVNLAVLSFLLSFFKTNLPKQTEIILLLLVFGSILVIFAALNLTRAFLKFAGFFKIKFIYSFALQLTEGFGNLKRPFPEILIMVLLSLLAAVSDCFIWVFIFLSIGFSLGFAGTLLGSLLSTLTFLVPAAPGYVGSLEAGTLAVYSGILSVKPAIASSAALVIHIMNLLVIPSTGIVSIYLLKFSLKPVWNVLKRRDIDFNTRAKSRG